ncbi:MAG TPA: hypothetical protein VFX76_09480 [Roseiflexaceae bacterium]|nr:hypothetical protein [Roseiflexaceae bacterium]
MIGFIPPNSWAQKSDIDPSDLSPLNYRKLAAHCVALNRPAKAGSVAHARGMQSGVESASGGPDTPDGNNNT